jgi:hypothetical protein
MINRLEFYFLCACQELVFRQQELLYELGKTLHIPPEDIGYNWAIYRSNQVGMIANSEWRYFFHGLECDLKHRSDARFLRIDFGPQGRLDTFTGWGVLQFIMTSKAPWQEFPELRAYLADKPPPFNELSGSHEKMINFLDRLGDSQLIEVADPELCMLVEKYTTINANGQQVVSLPEDLPERIFWFDSMVCNRLVISELGKQVINNREFAE